MRNYVLCNFVLIEKNLKQLQVKNRGWIKYIILYLNHLTFTFIFKYEVIVNSSFYEDCQNTSCAKTSKRNLLFYFGKNYVSNMYLTVK